MALEAPVSQETLDREGFITAVFAFAVIAIVVILLFWEVSSHPYGVYICKGLTTYVGNHTITATTSLTETGRGC